MRMVATKSLVLKTVKINRDDMHTKMALTEQVVSVIHLVYCLIILVIKWLT